MHTQRKIYAKCRYNQTSDVIITSYLKFIQQVAHARLSSTKYESRLFTKLFGKAVKWHSVPILNRDIR